MHDYFVTKVAFNFSNKTISARSVEFFCFCNVPHEVSSGYKFSQSRLNMQWRFNTPFITVFVKIIDTIEWHYKIRCPNRGSESFRKCTDKDHTIRTERKQ